MQNKKYFSFKQIYAFMKDRKVACPVCNDFCIFYEKIIVVVMPV